MLLLRRTVQEGRVNVAAVQGLIHRVNGFKYQMASRSWFLKIHFICMASSLELQISVQEFEILRPFVWLPMWVSMKAVCLLKLGERWFLNVLFTKRIATVKPWFALTHELFSEMVLCFALMLHLWVISDNKGHEEDWKWRGEKQTGECVSEFTAASLGDLGQACSVFGTEVSALNHYCSFTPP